MSNYNTQLQSNNTDLQTVLQTLQTKATAGQATPEISVSSNGLITATAGAKTSTYQLAFQPAKTVTPGTTSQVAVSSGYFTGGNVMVAGDSNLVAGNIKNGVSIFGVSGTLVEGSGGEAANEDAIVMGTLSNYFNDRVTTICSYAFTSYSLTTISFPVVTTIYNCAFSRCYSLTTISFPAATVISNYAFAYCSRLTTASFPVVKTIGDSAFAYCYSLTTISFPAATVISSGAFFSCPNLTTISFPVVTTIGSNAFYSCPNLTTISFPVVTTIGSNAFYSCSRLTTASFPAATVISNYAFRYCYRLKSLYLIGTALCDLSNSNAFSSTPYAGYSSYFSGTPYIYVPASLVSAYQSATNWAYYSSYFSAIEGEGGNLITFTVGVTEYQAEEGMTWAEWIDAAYRNYFSYTDNEVFVNGNVINNVLPSDLILDNFSYTYTVSSDFPQ